jgi:hypothetical protein
MQNKTDEYIIHYPSLPRFVTFESPIYYFFADKPDYLGISIISGQLFNAYTSTSF